MIIYCRSTCCITSLYYIYIWRDRWGAGVIHYIIFGETGGTGVIHYIYIWRDRWDGGNPFDDFETFLCLACIVIY